MYVTFLFDGGIMPHIHTLQSPFYILYKECLWFYNILFIDLAYDSVVF